MRHKLKKTHLFVALDFSSLSDANRLLKQLNPEICHVKIGLEMFCHFGPDWVNSVIQQGYQVFLDLKLHDIPNTVSKAVQALNKLNIAMCNVHALGGLAMMQAARKAVDLQPVATRPLLLAVTILTSHDQTSYDSIFANGKTTQVATVDLALSAKQAGLDGVVCSPHEASLIKKACGDDFLTVCPGIRMPSDIADDQKRIATPAQACKLGADFLVIGRPITNSNDPMQVVNQILVA